MNKRHRPEHGITAIVLRNGLSRRARVMLALASWVVYALAFIPLYYLAGPPVAALAVLPVAATGWLLGMPAGVLAGLLAFPLHILLLSLVGEAGWDLMTREGLPVSLVMIAIGAIVGGLGDLNERMRQEFARRKRAEEELRKRTEQVIRHQTALLELTKLDYSDLESALKGITEMDSKTLAVERVSVWLFTGDRSAIICEDLYKLSENLHEKGLRLEACEYPRYFQALEDSRAMAANDACTDPRTSELSDGYLKPCGITSMMDVSVRLHGKLVAIVCHEHVGPRREWTLEEQDFAASIADTVSLTLEGLARKQAEEGLQKRFKELEIHYHATMGRESRIIELKHQVNELLERLGEEKKYLTSDQ